MKRRIAALAVICLLLTAFFSSCNKEPPSKEEYKPYNYDLASYISIDSVLGVKYIPFDTTVLESEIEYSIIKDIKKAGLYNTDFTDLVINSPEDSTTLLGDKVKMTCRATVDGKDFPDGSVTDRIVELGSGMITVEGFESGLVGVSLNEEITLSLVLPADYSDYIYRNKEIEFKVTVSEITQRYICPDTLTEEQLKKIGDYTDFAEYYEAVRSKLTEQKEEYAKKKKIADCWQAVMEKVSIIAYPQVEMEMYVEGYLDYISELSKQNGFKSVEEYAASLNITEEDLKNQGMEYARGDVLQEMAVYYIARAEGFDSMSDELFNKFASPYAKDLQLDNVEQLVAVVGYYNVQKMVLTDVVKQYVSDNAIAEIQNTDEPAEE